MAKFGDGETNADEGKPAVTTSEDRIEHSMGVGELVVASTKLHDTSVSARINRNDGLFIS